jgi:hypothetical protein
MEKGNWKDAMKMLAFLGVLIHTFGLYLQQNIKIQHLHIYKKMNTILT